MESLTPPSITGPQGLGRRLPTADGRTLDAVCSNVYSIGLPLGRVRTEGFTRNRGSHARLVWPNAGGEFVGEASGAAVPAGRGGARGPLPHDGHPRPD